MDKEELLRKLYECNIGKDEEEGHIEADKLLLEYINDPEISEAFEKVDRWYS